MNIHLPAILMFTSGTRFWHTAIFFQVAICGYTPFSDTPMQEDCAFHLVTLKLRSSLIVPLFHVVLSHKRKFSSPLHGHGPAFSNQYAAFSLSYEPYRREPGVTRYCGIHRKP